MRFAHQPVRRGLLSSASSPALDTIGDGIGSDRCGGAVTASGASWLKIGAGSRTVERRRGGSDATMAGEADDGGGVVIGCGSTGRSTAGSMRGA
jgi:hypothetical protein